MTRLTRTARRGFTLLELIVVLLILGVLALIAVPTYSTVQQNSLNTAVLTSAQAIARDANAIAASGAAAGVATDTELETAAAEVTLPTGMTWNAAANTLTGTSGSKTATATLTATAGTYSAALNGAGGGGGGGAQPQATAADCVANYPSAQPYLVGYDPVNQSVAFCGIGHESVLFTNYDGTSYTPFYGMDSVPSGYTAGDGMYYYNYYFNTPNCTAYVDCGGTNAVQFVSLYSITDNPEVTIDLSVNGLANGLFVYHLDADWNVVVDVNNLPVVSQSDYGM